MKPSELPFEPEDPFKHDTLQRKNPAQLLTTIIGDLKVPFVLAVDSRFGTGKSTFIRMWREHLHKNDFKTIFFNAWENDFTENALISLLGESIDQFGKTDSPLAKKAIKMGGAIAKAAIPAVIKAATAGLIDSKEIASAVSEVTTELAEERIKKYQEEKKTIGDFKIELEAFVKQQSPKKPVIFFIDELDRCRPLFAIEVLEHAKHLFNVPGVVFVLAIDKKQLGHSLRAVYGTDLDVDGYLARFIDLSYPLPVPGLRKFIDGLINRFGGLNQIVSRNDRSFDPGELQRTLFILTKLFEVPLRTLEQLVTQFIVAWKMMELQNVDETLIATLIFLKRVEPQRYQRFISGEDNFEDKLATIRELLVAFPLTGFQKDTAKNLLVIFRVFGLRKHEASNLKNRLRSEAPNTALAATEPDNDLLWDRMGYYSFADAQRKSLLKLVDMAEHFNDPNLD
jgi:hypothetical protein